MKSTHSYDIVIDQVDKLSQLIKAVEVLKSVSLSPDGFVQTQITGVHPRVLLQLVWVGTWILCRWTFSKENYLRRDGVLLKGEGLQRQRWSNKELVSEASRNLKDLGGGSTSPGGSQQRLEMTQGKPPALGFRGETWGQRGNFTPNLCFQASLVAQMVKNLPAMQQTWVRSLGRKNPLEEDMATHTSILAWRIPLTEEPGGPQSM